MKIDLKKKKDSEKSLMHYASVSENCDRAELGFQAKLSVKAGQGPVFKLITRFSSKLRSVLLA